LRAEHLGQPPVVAAAYAATVRAQAAILTVINAHTDAMQEQVDAHFSKHPDAKVYLSQPGLGVVLGARCSPSSATIETDTPTPKPAATTPVRARSPASPARGRCLRTDTNYSEHKAWPTPAQNQQTAA
jgi:hypothetical protein